MAGGLLSGRFSRENQKPENSRRSEFNFPIVDKERAWNILDVMASVAEASVLTSYQDNLAAIAVALTPEEVQRLDEVSALSSGYPGWMLATQGFGRVEQPEGTLWDKALRS